MAIQIGSAENQNKNGASGTTSHKPLIVAKEKGVGSQTSWLARSRPLFSRLVPYVAAFCIIAWCYVSLRSHFAWDDAEPEILYQAWRLANHQDIYRGIEAPPFAFAAYTPIYYAFTAGFLKFTGLSYLPAKIISFLSALFIGWALICLSRKWTGSSKSGWWAACFLFLIPAFLYNSVRCHPQMMAVAFSTWSLVFFLRNRKFEALFISPLLAVLAFYTKQTQVALPIAIICYLALRDRRRLIPYASVFAISGLIPFLWLQKATHGLFLFNAVELAKLSYKVWVIPQIFMHHAGPIFLFIGLALVLLWQRIRSRQWEPLDFYFGCLFVITVVSLGRMGAHGQYVLELLVVTLIYLLRLEQFPELPGRDALVSIQIFLLFLYAPCFIFLEEGLFDRAANEAAPKIYSVIKDAKGPIISQQASFALFSRGEIYIQLFHFAGLSQAGMWDQRLLLNQIEKRTFPYVITEFSIEESKLGPDELERFTPEMMNALKKNYKRQELIYPYYIYKPAD